MYKTELIIKAFVFVLCLLMINGVGAMSLADVGKVCLFSGMSGVITLDGKPVVNARLVRTVNLNKDITDETTTDENGYFKFDAKFTRTVTKFLPQEFVASQNIVVHYQDKEYEMWSGVKRKPEENTESRGRPLVVECELRAEEKTITVNNSPIFSRCTWDVEPDPKLDIEAIMKHGY